MAGVRGVVREARNERRVLVPRETLASKVSAPPKTFRMRAEALCLQLRKKKDRRNMETYSTSFVIADLGGAAHVPPAPLFCFEHQVDIRGRGEVATRSVDVWLDRRKDVGLFQGMRNTSGGMEDVLECGVVVGG